MASRRIDGSGLWGGRDRVIEPLEQLVMLAGQPQGLESLLDRQAALVIDIGSTDRGGLQDFTKASRLLDEAERDAAASRAGSVPTGDGGGTDWTDGSGSPASRPPAGNGANGSPSAATNQTPSPWPADQPSGTFGGLLAPDLVPVSVTIRPFEGETLRAGAAAVVGWTVANAGRVTTKAAGWTDDLYLTRDGTFRGDGTDVYLGSTWTGQYAPLAPGQSYTLESRVMVPAGFTGEGYVVAVADRWNREGELNERNNVASQATRIAPGVDAGTPVEPVNYGPRVLESRGLSPAAAGQLRQGLSSFADWASGLTVLGALGQPLPRVGVEGGLSLGQLLTNASVSGRTGLGAILTERVVTPLASLLQGATTSQAVAGALGSTVGSVSSGYDAARGEFIVSFTMTNTSRRDLAGSQGFTLDTGIDLDPGASGAESSLEASVDASVTTSVSGRVEVGVRVQPVGAEGVLDVLSNALTAESFFVRRIADEPLASASAEVVVRDIDVSADLGVFEAAVENGTASLRAGVLLTLNNPDGDAEGRVTLAELTGTSPASLVNVGVEPSPLSIVLPLSGRLGSYSLGSGARVEITRANVLSGSSVETVSASGINAAVASFSRLGASDVASMLTQLATSMTDLSRSGEFGGRIPFLNDKTYSQVIDLGKSLTEQLVSPLTDSATGRFAFTTIQGALRLVAERLGVDVDALNPRFDSATREFTITVDSRGSSVSEAEPGLSFDLGPIGGISIGTSGSMVRVTTEAAFTATFGVVLTALGSSAAEFQAGSALAGLNAGRGVRGVAPYRVTNADGVETEREPANVQQIRLQTRGGGPQGQSLQFDLAIGGCVTVADVVSRIVTATGGRVAVDVDAAGYRLVVRDLTTGTGTLRITTLNDSSAAIDLGLTGADEDGDGRLEGRPLHGDDWTKHAFVQEASASASMAIVTTAPIQVNARLGFMEVSGRLGVNARGTLGAGLHAPGAPSNTRVTLHQLVSAIGDDVSSVLTGPSVGGNASASMTDIVVTGGLVALGPNPSITVSIADLADPTGFDVQYSDGAQNLARFPKLDATTVASLMQGASSYLSTIDGMGALKRPLPLINRSVLDLVASVTPEQIRSFASVFGGNAESVTARENLTLQSLAIALSESFGQPGGATVSYDASSRVVQINLLVDKSFRRDLPFDISGTGVNLPGGHLIEAGAAGQVRVDATARVDLRMGIDLSNPLAPAPFILDTSSVAISALASAQNVRFNASLGPLGVWVGHPTLDQALGQASLNNGANVPATFTAGLVDDTGPGGDRRYLVTELGPSVVEVAIAGRASATLPVFVGLRDNPQRLTPDVSLTVANLADPAGTTTFAAPDLASRVNQANLLTNTDAVVEGLAYLAERIDSALLDGVLNARLPVIGSALSTVTGVLRDYRNGVDALRRQLVSGIAADVVRNVLFTSLRTVLLDTAGGSGGGADGAVTEADIVITTSPSGDNVRFDLAIGGTLSALGAISFDAGLSSLGLSITGNPSVSLSYRLDLSFGVSRADGFYFDTRKQDELVVTAEAALGGLDATGRLGFMQVSARDNAATPSRLRAVVKVDLVHPSGGGTTLPVRLLASNPRTWTNATIEGGAALNLDLVTGMGSGQFPSLATTMRLDWPLSGPLRLSTLGQTPALSFTDIRLDLGSFLQNMARPIIDQVNRVAGPMRPVINTLTKALPVISDVMGREVTLLDLSAWYGNGRYQSSIDFVRSLSSIMNYVTPALGPGQYLNLGSFTVGGGGSGRSPIDLRMLGSLAGVQVDTSRAANTVAAMASRQDAAGDFFRKYRGLEGGGFSFPIMERPSEAFKLLMGQDATLFRYDTPRMQAGFSFSVFLPVFGVIGARFSAGMDVSGQMAFGYDTFGAREYFKSNFSDVRALAKGFYVTDIDANGRRVPLMAIKGSISAAAELNVDLSVFRVRAGASGGLQANVEVGLCRDIDDGDNDVAKVRAQALFDRGASVLEFSGGVTAELAAYLNARFCISLGPFGSVCVTIFDFKWELPGVTLLDFNIGCVSQPSGDVFTYDPAEGGVLTIATAPGSDIDDTAVVTRRGHEHVVRLNGRQQVETRPVSRIVFDGGAGDDSLTIVGDGATVTADLTFNGGAGRDMLSYAGTGRVTARGDEGNDTLEGGSGNDTLEGGSGNDAIVGGGGDDEIRGEEGNDYVRGEEGNDRVWGGAGNDTISGGAGDDDLEGEAGNDTIAGDEGDDWLVGGDGDDTLSGGDGSDAAWGDGVAPGVTVGFNRTPATYDGGFVVPPAAVAGGVASTGDASGNGNDTIRGGSDEQADYLFGAGGADVIDGEAGADYIDAGDGHDSVDGGAGRDVIRGGAGNDVLRGGAGNDRIDGDADNDTLTGGSEVNDGQVNSGDDTLRGGDGDDVVDGGDGADTIEGGAGNDRLVGGRGSDWIMGGVGNDTLIGGSVVSDPDATDSDRLEGGAGDDRISAGAGSDWIVGGDGNDTIDGGGGNDVVWGDNVATVASWQNRAANFQLDGSGRAVVVGLPTLVAGFATSGAGDGNDSIVTGGQSSWIFAAGGVQRTDGTRYGEDVIVCGAGADYIDAGAGSDSVTAGDGGPSDGRNWVIGGGGDDQIRGGAGSDVIWGDNPASGVTVASFTLDGNGMPQVPSTLTGGFALSSSGDDGSDVVQGGAGADWIFGSGDRTNITTGVRGDVLGGDAGNDHLDGGDGSDTITGGTGSDKALGGAGSDLIYGGSGANGGGAAQDRNELDGQGDGDTIIGDIGVDVIRGGAGGDFLRGLAGNDEMYGGDGGDTMYGNAGSDVMHGGSGAGAAADAADGSDTMYAGDGDWGGGAATDANTLRGGRDGDVLFGDVGNDTLYGGFGGANDTDASGDNGDVIRGLAGNDTIEGGVGDDRLYGGAGNDTIHGGSGMDLLQGDDADFAAPRGADTLVGGSDADAIVLDIQQGVTDNIQGHGNEYMGGAPKPSTSDATDRDVLIINGTGTDDTITLGEAVVASGQRPLRVSYASAGQSWTFNVDWRQGDGTPRIEQFQIEAGGGNDVVRFLQGPDGQGADAIDFTRLNALGASEFVSQIRGGFGTDVLVGGSGRDMIVGGPGQDFIFGGAGSDRLWGDDAADGIIGVAGNGDDYIYSGLGNDEVMGQGGNDILFAGRRVTQSGGSTSLENVLIAGAELLRIGNLAAIAGLPPVNPSDQPLLGAGWTDPADRSMNRMDGGIGDDSLFGGVGADFMQGGNRATERNQLYDRSNALMRSAADNTEDWLEYAQTLQNVWYYEVPDALTVDNVRISYVTSSTDTSLVGTNVIERVSGASTDLLMYLTVRQLPVGVLPGFSVADPSGPTTSTRTRWYDATRSGDASYRGEYLDSFNRYVDYGRDGYDVIIVNLKGGNDELRVGHTVRKSVWVFGGDGNDTVNVNVRGSAAIGDASQPLTAAEAATALSGAGGEQLRAALGVANTPAAIDAASQAWVTDIRDRKDILVGGPGNDALLGGPGIDWIFGGDGNDVIFGGIDGGDEAGRTQRSNVLSGGEGDDTFQLVPHASADGGDPDDIDGGPGIDTIAYVGQYVVPSGSGLSAEDRDRVFVGYDVTQGFYRLAANVRLASTSIPSPSTFAGTVSGLAWRYVQFRPTGSEAFLLDVRGGDDQVFAQPGNTVNGRTWGIGRAQITAGARLKMVILGGDGDDRLFGTAGPDVMHGQGGSDFVKGFAGDDLLTGDDAGQTSSDTVVGDENDAGVTANTSVDTPQFQVGPFRQYGLLAAALTPRSDANLVALPAAWYPSSTPVTIASPGSKGGFLVKEGDAPVSTPTFAATGGGPAWFTFTTKGDGGGSTAGDGEEIDAQNAERDRNFIRLLSAADRRTLVAGAVGASLRQTGPSTFVADAANASTPIVVRGAFGQVSHGLLEFDLSALLGVSLDTLAATLSLRTTSAAEGSLRVQTLTAEADMQAIGADGNARYADLSTVSVPAGTATVTVDLADAIRRASDAGRTRIGLRILPGQASTTVSINAPGRNATDATRLDMSVNAPGVVAAIFDEFGRPINTATGERLAVGAEAPTFGLIDMRTLQAGTYYLRVDRSGPGDAPVPYSIEVTPPAAAASWPSSSRDIIAGGAGLDHLVGGRGTDVIWDGVLGSTSGDTDSDVVHGETTEVSGSSGAITRTTPVGEDLIAKEPLPVNPSVQLTDPGIIAAARRSGMTLDASNRTTAAALAQAAWLDASHSQVAALEDLRWFVGLRSLTLAGNALPASATLHHIWQPANARTVIDQISNVRAYFDSNTLTPPAITVLSLADNPLLAAAKLAGPVDAIGSSPNLRMLDLDRAAPTGSIAGIAAFHDDETVIDGERHVSLRWLSLSGVLAPGALSVTAGQALEFLDVARNTGLNISALTGLASMQQLVLDGSTAASGSTFAATINTLEARTPRVGVSFDGDTLAPRRNAVTVRQAGAYSTTLRTSDAAPRFRVAFNQPVFWSGPVSPFTLNDPAGQPVVPLTVTGQGTRFIEIAAPSVTTDGSYRLLITGGLADEAGNAVASGDRDLGVVIVDRAAPTVQLVSPAPGSVSTSSVTFIDVRIADAHAGVDVATINAANFAVTGSVVTGVTAQAGGVWRLALASALAEGPFTVSVQAAEGRRVGDLVGNAVADGVIGTGMVDLLAPAGTVVGRGPVVNDDPGYVDIRWSDGAGTGLDAASFAPGNIAVTGVSVIEVETLADGVRRYRYAGRLPDGMISVMAGAQPVRDLTGRAATGEVGSFRLDSTALVGRLIAPNGQAVTSYATAVDAGFVDVRWDDGSGVGVDASTIGIDDLAFSQAGVSLTRVESRGGGVYRYHYASSTSRLTDQRVTTVRAVAGAVLDLAGNALQAGPVGDVIFDTLGPVATLQSPAGVVRMPAADARYVDLRWDDLTGLAAGLPAAADIVFVSGGVALAAAVTQVEVVAGGLHRYWYAPALPDGQIEVRVRAGAMTADGAGNRAAPHVAGTFTIDATGPRAALVGPSDGQVVTSPVWDIDVLLSDADGSGVDWATVTPAAFTISRGTLASVALLSGDVVRLQMASPLGEGAVTVSVGGSSPIRDRFGNAMAARVVGVFTVDLAAPTATLESEGWTGDITADRGHVDVRWSDGQGAGIDPASIKPANIRISGVTVDEVIMLEPGLFRYVYNADGDRLPSGAVTVETSSSSVDAVRDHAGRTAAAAVLASGTCVIDREPPRLVGSSLRSGASGWETLTLTFSERVNAATLIASGSISDLFTLTASDGGRVRLEASRFAWNDATRQLTIDLTVDGPGGSTLGMASKGTWWIVMRTGVVFDASGNGMMDPDGMEDGMFRIDLPLPRSAKAGGPQ